MRCFCCQPNRAQINTFFDGIWIFRWNWNNFEFFFEAFLSIFCPFFLFFRLFDNFFDFIWFLCIFYLFTKMVWERYLTFFHVSFDFFHVSFDSFSWFLWLFSLFVRLNSVISGFIQFYTASFDSLRFYSILFDFFHYFSRKISKSSEQKFNDWFIVIRNMKMFCRTNRIFYAHMKVKTAVKAKTVN